MSDTVPFEGVEKRLVIQFAPEVISHQYNESDDNVIHSLTGTTSRKSGEQKLSRINSMVPTKVKSPLRMSTSEWQEILDEAQCTIVSQKKLGDNIIYLLSESTLVVWDTGFLLKTCGRTTPFLALKAFLKKSLMNVCGNQKLKEWAIEGVNWMTYSRLEFIHPQFQVYPHQNFDQEIDYLKNELFNQLEFRSLPAGINTLHVAFASNGRLCSRPYHMQEALMRQVDVNCVRQLTGYNNGEEWRQATQINPCDGKKYSFHIDDDDDHIDSGDNSTSGGCGGEGSFIASEDGFLDSSEGETATDIKTVSPMRAAMKPCHAAELDEFWFDPCGYSSNALLLNNNEKGVDYFSCHVSPEEVTSYASLELGSQSSSSFSQGSTNHFQLSGLIAPFGARSLQVTSVSVGDERPVGGVTADLCSGGVTNQVTGEACDYQQIGSNTTQITIGAITCYVSHTGLQSNVGISFLPI